jgi:hypothetical protein
VILLTVRASLSQDGPFQATRRPLRWAIPQNCDGYHCRPKRLLAN